MFDQIIKRWKKANPISCHYLGIHDYDGELPKMDPDSIENRIKELNQDIKELQEFSAKTKMEQFEHNLILARLTTELFELEVRKEYEESPLFWIYPLTLIETSFTVRNFASIDDRIRIINSFLSQIPNHFNSAKYHLKESLSRQKIQMALQFLGGIISYLQDNLIAFVTKTDMESLLDQWSEVNINAVNILKSFEEDLKEHYLPKSHTNFALGKDKFMTLLRNTEGVDVSYEELLQAGEQDLERNYNTMMQIEEEVGDLEAYLNEVRTDLPNPQDLVKEASATLHRTRQFLVNTGIVPVPTNEQCEVIETPKFARSFAFAAMNTPGPFEVEEASEAFYWITPPDLSWSSQRINQFMQFFNRPFLEIVTIHEVWPGHYLQLLYNKQSKSEISKMLARSTAMIEGWAHYAEEMIYNAGYGKEYPDLTFDRSKLHIGQLFGALARNCRYISALKMHCEDWTVEDAKKLFMEKGFLPEPNAQIEANRGTVDPMYLNYTLGKLMIMKLREDYKRENGDGFSLEEFHQEILSYGSPPITVLREIMLNNPEGSIL